MMSDLADNYAIPLVVAKFIKSGFLELVSEEPDQYTVKFDIPSLGTVTASDRFTSYSLVWIHPEYNAKYCHFYLETPGDLPNFYVEIHSPDGPNEQVDDLNTVDELVDWMASMQEERFQADR